MPINHHQVVPVDVETKPKPVIYVIEVQIKFYCVSLIFKFIAIIKFNNLLEYKIEPIKSKFLFFVELLLLAS